MDKSTKILAVLSLACLAPAAALAQQPCPRPAMAGQMPMAGAAMSEAADRRLDSLVTEMNRTSGARQQTALAAVVTELVAQHRAMHAHMQAMMQAREGMAMPMMTHAPCTSSPSGAGDSAGAAHPRH